MHNKSQDISPAALKAGHEVADVPFKYILWAAIGLVVIVAVVQGVLLWMHMDLEHKLARVDRKNFAQFGVQAQRLPEFPRPRLQNDPHADLLALRERENEELTNYGWIDKQGGVARIPIADAMQLIVQKNLLPSRGTNAPAQQGASTLQLIQQRRLERGQQEERK